MKFLLDKKILAALFIALEAAIYITITLMGALTTYNVNYIRFSGICLCFVAAVICAFMYGRDGILISVALLFTAVGDFFLIIIHNYLEYGVSAFLVVQIVYFCRMHLITGKKPYVGIAIRLLIIAVLLAVMGGLSKLTSATVVMVCIYFPVIVANAIEAYFLSKYSKKYLLFAVGLTLFAICDMLVGVNNAAMIGLPLPEKLLWFVDRMAIWMFYLPAQVMLVFSVKKND